MALEEDRLSLTKSGFALVLGLFIILFTFFNIAWAEYRVALVIGNGEYSVGPLSDPPNDAQLMVGALKNLGFEVAGYKNVGKKQMIDLIRDFGKKLESQKDSVGVFYYSGHGMEIGGRNYMIPVGVAIESENDVEDEGIDVNFVLKRMDSAGNSMNFMFLDACRDNPFEKRFKSATKGLGKMDAPRGTIIGYAAEEHQVALQGKGNYSYFTEALAREIATPGIEAMDMLRRVRVAVIEKTGGKQLPVAMDKSVQPFYFRDSKARISRIDEDIKTEKVDQRTFTNSIGMQFVLIPAGSFTMGSRLSPKQVFDRYGGEENWYDSEQPPHDVKISQPFYLQTTEVTQGQWKKVMGDYPLDFESSSLLRGDDCPVGWVSWEGAKRFIYKLNQLEKTKAYRLPSEAEWEYACRAGTTTEFSFGDDASILGIFAWYQENSDRTTHRVAGKEPNSWGLYDMHGNVWEWMEDDWHGSYKGAPDDGSAWINNPRGARRVVRGGSWFFDARFHRSANRNSKELRGSYDLGFRLSRSAALYP